MPKTMSGVTPEKFVKCWQKAKTVAEFCELTGMSPAAATSRASYYRRRKGLGLKTMPVNGGNAVDVERLRKLID